jgi:hypothetical protein
MDKKKILSHIVSRALLTIGFLVVSAFAYPEEYDSTVARRIVNSLELSKFKSYIKGLADCGGREYNTQSNTRGREWLISTLEGLGYENVETQSNTYRNVYCTKVGAVSPDSMYIVSAHYDGMPVAEAANDDGSGCALVIEGARVLFDPMIKTHYSVRFILWNAEEKGLLGAKAYVNERRQLQGSSEPRWLGIIQHDMILYDHGLPPMPEQIPDADIDVDYQRNSDKYRESRELALELQKGCADYAPDYPAGVGDDMNNTDSKPFQDYIAAVSVRENERIAEIGNGSDPTWHTRYDTYDYFSDLDFNLGFNTVQTTIGTVCRLAGVHDSIPVAIDNPKVNKNNYSRLSPMVKEIKIFNTQGRVVAEYEGSCIWQQYFQGMRAQGKLPQGLYIIQTINAQDNNKGRFLRVID